MKHFLGAALAAALFLTQLPTVSAVGTRASSAILLDGESGRVLHEENAHDRRLIASITKLMTALVALESGHSLDEIVTVEPAWTGAEGSSIYLQAGEKITLEALLYGLLLRSGNDAALAVAGFCAGDVSAFVTGMNEKAQELGMVNSHFSNPNGLNAEDHYSTAYDMAILARACLKNETIIKITSTRSITIGTRSFTNHNKLLWQYEGCIGMKTGYTEKAGRTLVSAAQRDGTTLVCVTLNDPDDWADHTKLFDYGFENYQTKALTTEGETLSRIPVSGGLIPFCEAIAERSVSLCLRADETLRHEVRLDRTALIAPVQAGAGLGEVIYYLDETEILRVSLVAASDVPQALASRPGLLGRLRERLAG